jgi:hypothetical protein
MTEKGTKGMNMDEHDVQDSFISMNSNDTYSAQPMMLSAIFLSRRSECLSSCKSFISMFLSPFATNVLEQNKRE